MKISKKIKREMDKAKKEVRKQPLKPPKKRRIAKIEHKQETRSPSGKWIKDEWGNQGEVFFDGCGYWGIVLKLTNELGVSDVRPIYWSIDKWEKRKKLENYAPNSETTETEKPLSSTPKITKSTKVSKIVPKKKSPMKSGKTVNQVRQVKWR